MCQHLADHSEKHLDHASTIALHYGFRPIAPLTVSQQDKKDYKQIEDKFISPATQCTYKTNLCEKVALLQRLINQEASQETFLVSQLRTEPRRRPASLRCVLDLVGSDSAIAESLNIQAAYAVLKEHGIKDAVIHINSLGDKESFEEFERHLRDFCRRHISDMSPDLQKTVKDNALGLFFSKCKTAKPLLEIAPKPINYLKDSSRLRFMEILEHLEELNLPYVVNENLIGYCYHVAETVYEIRSGENVVAYGARQDKFVSRLGYRRHVPLVETNVILEKKKSKKHAKQKLQHVLSPHIAFVHLGSEAKMKSLRVIEELRQYNIRVNHILTETKCSPQMQYAEKLKPKFMLIMGMKEALENSVLLRDMSHHRQVVVPLAELNLHIKNLQTPLATA